MTPMISLPSFNNYQYVASPVQIFKQGRKGDEHCATFTTLLVFTISCDKTSEMVK